VAELTGVTAVESAPARAVGTGEDAAKRRCGRPIALNARRRRSRSERWPPTGLARAGVAGAKAIWWVPAASPGSGRLPLLCGSSMSSDRKPRCCQLQRLTRA